MTSPQQNLPWLSKSLLASIREKNIVNGRPSVPSDLSGGLFLKSKLSESSDLKKFKTTHNIKSKRQDENGVSPLEVNSQLHSDSRRKAKILNNQFCLVSTS